MMLCGAACGVISPYVSSGGADVEAAIKYRRYILVAAALLSHSKAGLAAGGPAGCHSACRTGRGGGRGWAGGLPGICTAVQWLASCDGSCGEEVGRAAHMSTTGPVLHIVTLAC